MTCPACVCVCVSLLCAEVAGWIEGEWSGRSSASPWQGTRAHPHSTPRKSPRTPATSHAGTQFRHHQVGEVPAQDSLQKFGPRACVLPRLGRILLVGWPLRGGWAGRWGGSCRHDTLCLSRPSARGATSALVSRTFNFTSLGASDPCFIPNTASSSRGRCQIFAPLRPLMSRLGSRPRISECLFPSSPAIPSFPRNWCVSQWEIKRR